MHRAVILACVSAVITFSVGGCGPRLSEDELGEVLYEIPEIPGADKTIEIKPWPEEPEGFDAAAENSNGFDDSE